MCNWIFSVDNEVTNGDKISDKQPEVWVLEYIFELQKCCLLFEGNTCHMVAMLMVYMVMVAMMMVTIVMVLMVTNMVLI